MLFQFATKDDGQTYQTDTLKMEWRKLVWVPGNQVASCSESGKLIPMGWGRYAMEGRRQGLCTFGTTLVGIGRTIEISLRANQPVKDFTMPEPINQVLYKIMPEDPRMIEEAIRAMAENQLLLKEQNGQIP